MTTTESRIDLAPSGASSRSTHAITTPGPADTDPSIAALDRYRSECEQLAHRMNESHPGVPLAVISELVAQASDELATSRVQSFRLILVERVVRRGLTDLERTTDR